jgi:hypothetical protein
MRSASLGKDCSLRMQHEHIFELASVVHGYSVDPAMIDEFPIFRPKVAEENSCKCEILQQHDVSRY